MTHTLGSGEIIILELKWLVEITFPILPNFALGENTTQVPPLPKETLWMISNKSRDHVLFINTYVMCTGDYLQVMFAIHDCKFSRLYMAYIYNVPKNRDQLTHNMCYSHFLNKHFQ